VKVANPGLWMVISAIVILLAGVVVWGFIGKIDTTMSTAIITDGKNAVIYIGESDAGKLEIGMTVRSEHKEYTITDIAKAPIKVDGSLSDYAIYASGLCSSKALNRLKYIYTFDSPGFDKDLVDTSVFSKLSNKISSFVPKDSVIGMLMEVPTAYTVVDSDAFGFSQHDIFSWFLKGISFQRKDTLSSFSIGVKKTMTKWLELLDLSQRRDFVNSLFKILEECKIYEIRDFEKISFSTVVTAIKSFSDLDSTSKECVLKAIGLFFKAAHNREEIQLDDF
jgi:hypothetical protein